MKLRRLRHWYSPQTSAYIHEIDETSDGQTFIAMACYDGETLKKRIERGDTGGQRGTYDITMQIAQGLAKAHGAWYHPSRYQAGQHYGDK